MLTLCTCLCLLLNIWDIFKDWGIRVLGLHFYRSSTYVIFLIPWGNASLHVILFRGPFRPCSHFGILRELFGIFLGKQAFMRLMLPIPVGHSVFRVWGDRMYLWKRKRKCQYQGEKTAVPNSRAAESSYTCKSLDLGNSEAETVRELA